MKGRGYAIFDTAVGRCGVAWSDVGVLGVQLPEAREIDTRRRLYRLYPEARELPPPPNVQTAIDGLVAALRGNAPDFSDVAVDLEDIPPFSQRVYDCVRAIPRGETRTHGEIASSLRASGALNSVALAIAKNPFVIIVPCHRVLETAGDYADTMSPHSGTISRRHLLSIEGVRTTAGKTLFDALLPVAPSRLHP
jgi:methylated-DNA-[protein]-cysteine S-methyltransferase